MLALIFLTMIKNDDIAENKAQSLSIADISRLDFCSDQRQSEEKLITILKRQSTSNRN